MEKLYNCCIMLTDGTWITWHGVNNLKRLVNSLDTKYSKSSDQTWKLFNVYDKEDKKRPSMVLGKYKNDVDNQDRYVPNTKTI
jgi:hypothetical protein